MPFETKHMLAESFKKLLSRRRLDKITVKDIVEDCGVNRQTFYYHFHNVYDLMEWAFRDAAETLAREQLEQEDWIGGVEALMDELRRDKSLILNAYHSISHETVADFLKRILRPHLLRFVQAQAEEMETPPGQEDVDFVADIYTVTVAGIIMEWIGRQKMEGTEERLRRLFAAMRGNARFMLRNLEETRVGGVESGRPGQGQKSKNDENSL